MSRPSRRQVQSYQPPASYTSVPLASPPRRSSVQAQGQGPYLSSVAGPRPPPSQQSHQTTRTSRANSLTSSAQGHHRRESSQGHAYTRQGHAYSNSQAYSQNLAHTPRPTERRPSARNGVTQGVATGQIGSAYGPYSYHSNPPPKGAGVYGAGRFSNAASENSLSTGEHHTSQPPNRKPPPQSTIPQRTTTVPTYMWDKEPDLDDALHTPDPRRDNSCTPFSCRGYVNVAGILVLLSGLLALFIGFPVIDYARSQYQRFHGYNIGGVNATGQIPSLPAMRHLIDPDTPREALTRIGTDGQKYDLVFSDEFNVDGRTFYPGDDPYWEAVDLHYWVTNNLEWYDPSQVTTADGKLVITFEQRQHRNMNFISGMVTTWNKLCFTTGYVEVSVSLPGDGNTPGLWPAAWTMGNLGRAGYGATTDGMWPYTYDSCDTGTFPSQRARDGFPGEEALRGRGPRPLSSLPGQRTSACSCPGSDHPGPRHDVGRSAPEVDIFEAEVPNGSGAVSQSMQIAPFNRGYDTRTEHRVIYNDSVTYGNQYTGGEYQQSVSCISRTDPQAYDGEAYSTYAYELWSNPKKREEGYITWFSDGQPRWTVNPSVLAGEADMGLGPRLISEEPMYVLLNLGMALDFEFPDFNGLKYPATMRVDYVRIYQREGLVDGVTCNPPDRPTTDYIKKHEDAYTNPNITQWTHAKTDGVNNNTFPRNRLYDGC